MTTGGNKFGLDDIQADDAYLDRLANREELSGEGLDALLGAWVREIDNDAEEMAGTPMPWAGTPGPKTRSLHVHRAAAVAGALVVTLSGGMAAVALMPDAPADTPVGVVQSAFRGILPQQPHVSNTTDSAVAAPGPDTVAPVTPQIGAAPDAEQVSPNGDWSPAPLARSGLPTAEPTGEAGSAAVPGETGEGSQVTGGQQQAGTVGPSSSNPTAIPPIAGGTSSGSGSTSSGGKSGGSKATDSNTTPESTATKSPSPEPTSAETATSPAPPEKKDEKDSSHVTTPGGVLPSDSKTDSKSGSTTKEPQVGETRDPAPSGQVGTPAESKSGFSAQSAPKASDVAAHAASTVGE